MDSAFASDTAATIATWVGGSLTLLSLISIGLIFALRVWSEHVRKNREIAIQRWEETLFRATEMIEDDNPSDSHSSALSKEVKNFLALHPSVENRDLPHLLYEWNYIHESVAGESKNGLNLLARALNLYEKTRKLLKSPFLDRRLLAINTLGNLGSDEAYADLEKILSRRDPVISSWAWRALFRIDTQKTIEKHFSIIATREDWSPIFVARVLQEIDADTRSEPLCRLVEECYAAGVAKDRQMSRLISYLSLTHIYDHTELVNRILLESNEIEVLIACLRLVNSDDDLTRIRDLINDERWEVRMHAALTLGRLGHEEDVELLIPLLNDPDWWVRYRTASALCAMPGMTEKKIEKLAKTLPNQFARDILRQVLAEMRLLCFNQTSFTLSK